MFYVKTTPDGALEQYPYTLTDLRQQNKSTSWPKQISDEVAADFNVFRVTSTPQPDVDYTVNLSRTAVKVNGAWLEKWVETPATPEEIATRTDNEAATVRSKRNQLLSDSDWTQLSDSPLDPDGKAAWALYRESLRMVPQQAGFPWNVQWPPEPGPN